MHKYIKKYGFEKINVALANRQRTGIIQSFRVGKKDDLSP